MPIKQAWARPAFREAFTADYRRFGASPAGNAHLLPQARSRLIPFQIKFGQRPKKCSQFLIQDQGAPAELPGFERSGTDCCIDSVASGTNCSAALFRE